MIDPNNRYSIYNRIDQSPAQSATLLQRVSYLLCTALLVTAGAAYAGSDLPSSSCLVFGIGTFVCIFAMRFAQRVPGLNLLLLYVLSVLEGLFFGPLLHAYARLPLGGQMIAEAAGLSGFIIAGLGTYVWISNKDFGYLGKFLFWALLAMIVVGIVSMFWHALFAMPQIYLLYELVIVAIFVGFTLYDFSNIKYRYGPNDYVFATVALYLDFINLFWALLQILMSLTGMGGSRRN